MITKSQKKKLKKYLQATWVEDVRQLLERQGVTNKKGNPYSEQMIKSVRYGIRENIDIELAILSIYKCHRQVIENYEDEKRKILSA